MFALGRRTPTVLIVSGVLALIFGIVAMVWPVGAAISMVIIWASYALVDGISALVLAFRPEGKEGKGFLIFSGIMGIIAGLVGLFMPVSSAVALAWVLGIWLLARGILEIGAAFGHERATPRWLLVVGGSLGAMQLNKAVPQALAKLGADGLRYEVRHQAGEKHIEAARAAYGEAGVQGEVTAFIADMAQALGWADLVICRAGALTIAELAAAGVGAILVPYPHAVDDHQTHNAQFLVDAGAALVSFA